LSASSRINSKNNNELSVEEISDEVSIEEISEGDLSSDSETKTQTIIRSPIRKVIDKTEENRSRQISTLLTQAVDLANLSDSESEDEDDTVTGNVSINDILF